MRGLNEWRGKPHFFMTHWPIHDLVPAYHSNEGEEGVAAAANLVVIDALMVRREFVGAQWLRIWVRPSVWESKTTQEATKLYTAPS